LVGFRLANAEARHRQYPRSFFIPDRAERESLRPGDLVRLHFEIVSPRPGQPEAERMWVEVTGRDAAGYVGVLTNVPVVITTIGPGGTVRFGPEHVMSTIEDWPLLEKRVLVSRRSHDGDLRPCWVYREPPDNEADSGWRALVGDEPDEEVNDPANVLPQQVGFLLERWPELRPVFATDPDNGGWSWDERSGRYRPAGDGPGR
jgi:hypothetical protein